MNLYWIRKGTLKPHVRLVWLTLKALSYPARLLPGSWRWIDDWFHSVALWILRQPRLASARPMPGSVNAHQADAGPMPGVDTQEPK